MSTNDNVIELKGFLNSKNKTETSSMESAPVQSISKIRKDMINEERRQVKRTLLTEFVGASMVIPGSGLVKVILNDISVAGVSFDVPLKYGKLEVGDQVAVRVYLNHTTYFPLMVTVTNCRFDKEDGVHRHGAEFLEGTVNEIAIQHFIKFMETVSTSLKADAGDILLTK